jgi:hypothetical protein
MHLYPILHHIPAQIGQWVWLNHQVGNVVRDPTDPPHKPQDILFVLWISWPVPDLVDLFCINQNIIIDN